VTDARCSCGFTESDAEQLTDHLLESFTPPDSRGNDGQLHEELAQTCACGFTPAAPGDLDPHFLAVFTPADSRGKDGKMHTPTGRGSLRGQLAMAPDWDSDEVNDAIAHDFGMEP
jgi:hypothetical protein